MTLPINLLMWLLAALPIAMLFVLMAALNWGASKAAPVSLLVAAVSALLAFRAPPNLVFLEAGKGLWNALTVLIVIWPAILIYEVAYEAKSFDSIRRGIEGLTSNELLQLLAVGWVFVSFLQGITGFGVPVAVGAPLLVGMGVRPVAAVLITLLGHAWANTFGTLAVAWEALVQQTGIAGTALYYPTAMWAAIFIWIFNLLIGLAICWLYGKGKAVRNGLPAVMVISLIHGGGQLALSQVDPTIAALVPSCAALAALFLLGRLPRYKKRWMIVESQVLVRSHANPWDQHDPAAYAEFHRASFPYYVLISITLLVLLVPPIKSFLGRITLGFSFPETRTGYGIVNAAEPRYSPLRPLIHAGLFLFVAACSEFVYFRAIAKLGRRKLGLILNRTVQKTLPATFGIVTLIVMSRIMSGSGQTTVLAVGTADLTGRLFPLLSPAVGVLGSFMTSSNLASNILFGKFQQTSSQILNLKEYLVLAAQTTGGALGNTICPGNVLLGTTTTGALGSEGTILRRILPFTAGVAVLIGLLVLLLSLR